MEEQRLREIEERSNQATPGPWMLNDLQAHVYTGPGYSDGNRGPYHCIAYCENDYDALPEPQEFENAAFIAHARTDVPDLVAEVRRLRTELQESTTCQDATCATRTPPREAKWCDVCVDELARLIKHKGDTP